MNPWTNVLCITGRGVRKYKLLCPQVLLKWFVKPLCSIASSGKCSSRWQHAESTVLGSMSWEPPDLEALPWCWARGCCTSQECAAGSCPSPCSGSGCIGGHTEECWGSLKAEGTGHPWSLGARSLSQAAALILCWGWALPSEHLNKHSSSAHEALTRARWQVCVICLSCLWNLCSIYWSLCDPVCIGEVFWGKSVLKFTS